MNPYLFESLAGRALSQKYGQPLGKGKMPGVPKEFDFVSPDGSVVGDAKFYTLVGGTRPPPAKFSVIAEHVWLLEKTRAPHKFLVCGNDRRVPELWLARHGSLVGDVAFYFFSEGDELVALTPTR
jgi:hypothetical protein